MLRGEHVRHDGPHLLGWIVHGVRGRQPAVLQRIELQYGGDLRDVRDVRGVWRRGPGVLQRIDLQCGRSVRDVGNVPEGERQRLCVQRRMRQRRVRRPILLLQVCLRDVSGLHR